MSPSIIYTLLFLLLTTNWPQTDGQPTLTRIEADYDESSCICGLSKEILDKLESIILASASSCSTSQQNQAQILDLDPKTSSHLRPLEVTNETKVVESVGSTGTAKPSSLVETEEIRPIQKEESNLIDTQLILPVRKPIVSIEPEASKSDIKENGGSNKEGSKTSGSSYTSITLEKLTAEILKLEKQVHELQQETDGSENSQKSEPNKETQNDSKESLKDPKETTVFPSTVATEQPVDNGFLDGLTVNVTEISKKLNQSEKVENLIQSTVPNVVSNIFTNIQNLTQQTGIEGPAITVSGESIVKGDTSDEITASGEALFRAWIETQIQTLHLTASVANQIRKSSMTLFRKIVKQYVDSVEKMSGSLEDNMRRATQTALNNTQSLIGFLLHHYINLATGLMRIIGDEVTLVGKRLESTGDTIAHISLNPFDIVSNVMESLPNPSEYSEYFRGFGKQLLGQITGQSEETKGEDKPQDAGNSEAPTSTNEGQKPKGLIAKTMGALSKTLGSWLG